MFNKLTACYDRVTCVTDKKEKMQKPLQHRLTMRAVLPLLLTEDALPSDDFNVAALQSLRAFPRQPPGEGRILYVPR